MSALSPAPAGTLGDHLTADGTADPTGTSTVRDRDPLGPRARSTRTWRSRTLGLALSIVLLGAVCLVSLVVGARAVPFDVVLDALRAPDGSDAHLVVTELRVPRTVLGVLVGAALGVSGALIQALTRNPLADPGILGVNAGASFGVVLGIAVFGVTSIGQYLPFAFAGAVLATVAVYGLASRGAAATPLRLTLVGIAFGAVLTGISSTLTLLSPETFDRMRFWGTGSITDRPPGTVAAILPFVAAGLLLALLAGRSLDAVALGDDLARSLGARIGTTRVVTIVAVTLLCGAATAAAGPIGFVGLMVPHTVRWFTGPNQRWILAFSTVLAPVLLLGSDVLGRLIVRPAELEVGIVTALVGAPVLVALVRRKNVRGL